MFGSPWEAILTALGLVASGVGGTLLVQKFKGRAPTSKAEYDALAEKRIKELESPYRAPAPKNPPRMPFPPNVDRKD